MKLELHTIKQALLLLFDVVKDRCPVSIAERRMMGRRTDPQPRLTARLVRLRLGTCTIAVAVPGRLLDPSTC